MEGFWILFGVPITVGIIILILEYWLIQPLRDAKGGRLPFFSPIRRNWSTATKRALKSFKTQHDQYKWFFAREKVNVESMSVDKGKATLNLKVTTRARNSQSSLYKLFIEPLVIARYQLVIDRSGDILKKQTLDLKPLAKIKFSSSPIKQETESGISVIFTVLIENHGRSGKFCPVFECFTVNVLLPEEERFQWTKAKLEPIEVDSFDTEQVRCEVIFSPPEAPLVSHNHKVKISVDPYR